MKKLLMSSAVLLIFSAAMLLFQYGCTKEAIAQTTPTTIPVLTKPEILVAKSWRIDQLDRVINNVYASYISGGTNTTGVNYSNTKYTFNTDGTGVYIDELSTSHNISWQFMTGDQRTIKFTVPGQPLDNWEMVEISGNYLHATEHFTVAGNTNCMHTFRLVQIP